LVHIARHRDFDMPPIFPTLIRLAIAALSCICVEAIAAPPVERCPQAASGAACRGAMAASGASAPRRGNARGGTREQCADAMERRHAQGPAASGHPMTGMGPRMGASGCGRTSDE